MDTKVLPLLKEDTFLAAVQNSGEVKLIFTLSKKNKSPFCSFCSRQNCKHFKQYKEHKNATNNESNSDGSESEDNEGGNCIPPADHYAEIEPIEEYARNYGYNLTKILYPFKNDIETRGIWIRRMDGHFDLPERIFPEFVEGFACKHGDTFDPSDANLVEYSTNSIIYTENSEKVYNIKTFSRKTLGACRCRQQADTHKLLLWHVGNGKFFCYSFLSSYMHNMRANGTPMNGMLRARCERLNSIGVKTTLKHQDFTRASNGFISKITFEENTFSCPKCGDSPKYFVADGKSDGPTKRKVDHLKELGAADEDEGCLEQGSIYKDRVLIHRYKE